MLTKLIGCTSNFISNTELRDRLSNILQDCE